ncbi:MAG: hypothetical protein COB67_03720 [SAR324 cluster bacterium]|uniref:Uncharacterized protein n=1 Tax=SAR324 cluster bacterium TaxID=2024889 RepID=A0A2A4T8A2_9DELT|nr:MAG: hypothetical protein COB67_03720 [SAR324 cluster bacterium]
MHCILKASPNLRFFLFAGKKIACFNSKLLHLFTVDQDWETIHLSKPRGDYVLSNPLTLSDLSYILHYYLLQPLTYRTLKKASGKAWQWEKSAPAFSARSLTGNTHYG